MSKFDDCIQPSDKVIFNEDLGCRVNLSQLNRVANRSDIKDYITRAVPDIARKCGCKQDEVWAEMNRLSVDKPRWKIPDPEKAMEYGFVEVVPNEKGIISLNIADIPSGISIFEHIENAIEKGIIVQFKS